MFLKGREFKRKRAALKAQVDWLVYQARWFYIDGDVYMCNRLTEEAGKVQDKILRLYPRYQKPIKTKRTIIVPVTVPNRKVLEVTE